MRDCYKSDKKTNTGWEGATEKWQEENTVCCKDYVDWIITGQEIVIKRKSIFQSVEEKDTTNEVAVVLKGEWRLIAKMEVIWNEC